MQRQIIILLVIVAATVTTVKPQKAIQPDGMVDDGIEPDGMVDDESTCSVVSDSTIDATVTYTCKPGYSGTPNTESVGPCLASESMEPTLICQPECSQGCKQGTCTSPDICECNSGWTGDDCGTAIDPVCLPPFKEEALLVLGGRAEQGGHTAFVDVITSESGTLKDQSDAIPSVPAVGAYWSAGHIGDQVVVCAYYVGPTCHHLDLATQSWVGTSTLQQSRHLQQSIVHNGTLYLLSGSNSGKTVEKLNAATNTWSLVPEWKFLQSMPTKEFCAVEHNNFVYVIYKTKIYRLSTDTSQWEEMPSRKLNRVRLACTVTCINDDVGILAVGGLDPWRNPQKSAEFYSFDKNSWSTKADMNIERDGPGVFFLSGQTGVVGGLSDSKYEDSMEVYDGASDSWSVVDDAKLGVGRAYFASAKVPKWD